MSSDEKWKRLGRLLAEQRGRIEPNARAFADQSGLNYRLVWDLENAARANYRPATLTRVEVAYDWEIGSIQRVLNGSDPTPAPQGPPLVPAGGTPQAEQDPPDLLLKGAAPLEEGEELKAWNHGEGRRHYRFTKTEGGDYAAISATYSADDPLESVVKRLRASAGVALM